MNGPHDMGGMQCYGAVLPEQDEPIFHGEWEKKALALTVAMGFTGSWNLDASRYARESLPADFYLTKSYYQIWMAGLEKLMLARGMVTDEELQTGKALSPPVDIKRKVAGTEVAAVLAKGGPVDREPDTAAGFRVGEAVRTKNIHPQGHTRLPRYARGKVGTVERIHGFHVFPDSNARGDGEQPAWLYAIRFEGQELFGRDAESDSSVMVDCWEPYLERA